MWCHGQNFTVMKAGMGGYKHIKNIQVFLIECTGASTHVNTHTHTKFKALKTSHHQQMLTQTNKSKCAFKQKPRNNNEETQI